MKTTITKRFGPFPAAHRQPKHDGHCAWIHGHNWRFEVTLTASRLDSCGFVMDVGKMDDIKSWFQSRFDHTLLLNQDDPYILQFLKLEQVPTKRPGRFDRLVQVVVVPDCSMEGLAKWAALEIQSILAATKDCAARRVRVVRVVCFEDEKNSATFEP